jgi:RNA polymerase sigma factor (sigma-70 family)
MPFVTEHTQHADTAVLGGAAPRRGAARRPAGEIGALVVRAARGHQDAWTALVDEFGGLVWSVARAHRLGDADAADVVQTTWLHLVEHLGSLRDPSRIGPWLATTARHESLRAIRRQTRAVPSDDPFDHLVGAADIETTLAMVERDQILWAALEQLGERDRALLRMLVADPRPSYEEIGAALDMPVGSIGPTRARCLRKLRREAERLGLTSADVEA